MTRKKVKLAYITNDSARKATFKKRKKGLMKKVSELSTLCDIRACAIIYSPYDTQAEVWPSPAEVHSVLADFKKMPEMEQSKKMVNQESFLRQRIAKANEQLKKHRKDNREKEVTQAMFQSLTGKSLHNLTMMDLNDLGWMIEQNLKDINKRINELNNNKVPQNYPEVTAPPPTAESVNTNATAGPSGEHVNVAGGQQVERAIFEGNTMENMQRQQWFMDLMSPQEHLGFGGDEMILPFGDNTTNSLWSNAFFP